MMEKKGNQKSHLKQKKTDETPKPEGGNLDIYLFI